MSNLSYFRPCIARMAGYTPGAQPPGPVYAKLNANENPYPPSPKVLEALRAAACESLRLYPDAMSTELRARIAAYHGLAPQQVLVGNGSDDLLTMIVRSFVGPGDVVAAPYPTYPLYEVLVEIQDATMRWVDYPPDFSLPEGLAEPGARVTFVCNPNSPSGTWVDPAAIGGLAGRLGGILVVDEAYVDFAEGDSLGLLGRFPNAIILRSFSKSFSLCGVRLGYGLASEEIIRGLAKAKDSYNVNRFAMAAGVAALDDVAYMRANVAKLRAERERLADGLRRMGLRVLPSQANFVCVVSQEPSPAAFAADLAREGILVRTFGDPRLKDWLRISIGTPEQNSRILSGIEATLRRKTS
ncbi:MAG: histidinol-phosphate transaminase [Planctomycetes bacterium]|nr:histidinol-phosphate transaminase [Planctomycetota bacterium]